MPDSDCSVATPLCRRFLMRFYRVNSNFVFSTPPKNRVNLRWRKKGGGLFFSTLNSTLFFVASVPLPFVVDFRAFEKKGKSKNNNESKGEDGVAATLPTATHRRRIALRPQIEPNPQIMCGENNVCFVSKKKKKSQNDIPRRANLSAAGGASEA